MAVLYLLNTGNVLDILHCNNYIQKLITTVKTIKKGIWKLKEKALFSADTYRYSATPLFQTNSFFFLMYNESTDPPKKVMAHGELNRMKN